MELLLNLAWLLLVIPAFCLWRAATRGHEAGRSRLVLLALACTLAILFPVVSASDDIQAMRPEMEEAGGRDSLRSPQQSRFVALAPVASNVALLLLAVAKPELTSWARVTPFVASLPSISAIATRAGRSPPRSFHG